MSLLINRVHGILSRFEGEKLVILTQQQNLESIVAGICCSSVESSTGRYFEFPNFEVWVKLIGEEPFSKKSNYEMVSAFLCDSDLSTAEKDNFRAWKNAAA